MPKRCGIFELATPTFAETTPCISASLWTIYPLSWFIFQDQLVLKWQWKLAFLAFGFCMCYYDVICVHMLCMVSIGLVFGAYHEPWTWCRSVQLSSFWCETQAFGLDLNRIYCTVLYKLSNALATDSYLGLISRAYRPAKRREGMQLRICL